MRVGREEVVTFEAVDGSCELPFVRGGESIVLLDRTEQAEHGERCEAFRPTPVMRTVRVTEHTDAARSRILQ
jgi:hypothetical protein